MSRVATHLHMLKRRIFRSEGVWKSIIFFMKSHEVPQAARGPLRDLAISKNGPRVHVALFPILILMKS